MKIQIGKINKETHSLLKGAAAQAGYAASIETVNETTCIIDLGDNAHRNAAGITISEIEAMIGSLICIGFSVERVI